MKTSYVHVQTPHGRSLGFSARILAFGITPTFEDDDSEVGVNEGRHNDKGDRMCFLSITYCNKKDKHFCKRTAREELASKPEEWVRCKDVPKMLAAAHARAMRVAHIDPSKYNYILGRFL